MSIWKSEPPAPKPVLLTEIQDSPALRGLLAPVAEAAAAMRAALDAAKASGDETAKALLERIEVRDTSLIATLNEIVAAVEKVTVQATLETPQVIVNVPQQAAPIVNVAAPAVTVSPTIVAEAAPRTWTFTHTYDGFGNIKSTKAVPSLT